MARRNCHYCLVRAECQLDHFPVPARHGGQDIVPACTTCHNLKDRIPYGKWPTDIRKIAIQSLLSVWRPEFSEADIRDAVDHLHFSPEMSICVTDSWALLTPMGRVLYGKLIALSQDQGASQQ